MGLLDNGLLLRDQLSMHYRPDFLHPVFERHLTSVAPKMVVTGGACNGVAAAALERFFDCQIYAFECNPRVLDECRVRFGGIQNVELVPAAMWDESGRIPFYPVTGTIFDNRPISNRTGASSCFRARDDYRERYRQDSVEVDAIRLSEFYANRGLDGAELLCLDVQGAALHVLRGAGRFLNATRAIVVELEHRPIYENQDMFDETNDFLVSHGFKEIEKVSRDDWFADYLYVS